MQSYAVLTPFEDMQPIACTFEQRLPYCFLNIGTLFVARTGFYWWMYMEIQ